MKKYGKYRKKNIFTFNKWRRNIGNTENKMILPLTTGKEIWKIYKDTFTFNKWFRYMEIQKKKDFYL